MNGPTPEQTAQWRADGVLPLPGALSGGELSRVQEAFAREAAEARPGWLEGVSQGTRPAAFFDIPDPLSRDPLFLDLVDHPSWYGHLMAFTGGQATFVGPQFRTLPPAPLSYVGWHYDIPRSTPLHLKVQIYLDPVSRREGAFAYVPGSHRPDSGPYPLVAEPEAMPGHRLFEGEAGTAVLFNSYGLHTSMANRSRQGRRSIILIYEVYSEATFNPGAFARFADRLTTADRRQLFRREPRPQGETAP